MEKRSRSDLKSYFVTNAIPTEGQFAAFIDSVPNLKDDGLVKADGASPLGIEAVGELTGEKKALQLYDTSAEGTEWTLSLRPRVTANDASSQKRGLSIADRNNVSRLFIDRNTLNVGVGTIEPKARLHVAGDLQVDGALKMGASSALAVPSGTPVSGVQVIDFAIAEFKSKPNFQNNGVWTSQVVFSQPVVKAVPVINQFYMYFASEDAQAVVYNLGVNPVCTVDGNTVNVTITLAYNGLRTWSNGSARLLILAILKNAV